MQTYFVHLPILKFYSMKNCFLWVAIPLAIFASCGDELENQNGQSKEDVIPEDITVDCEEMSTSYGETNGYDYVDLGLPSGNLWATMNMGASAIQDYGDLYEWAELVPQETPIDYNKYYMVPEDRSKEGYIKYVSQEDERSSGCDGFTDDKITLELSDDAVHQKMKGSWRIPTKCDWLELDACCELSYCTYKGVAGVKYTAKNGQWIFFPKAGTMNDDGRILDGKQGNYWSSSLVENYGSTAWSVSFFNDWYSISGTFRINCLSLRGVCPTK